MSVKLEEQAQDVLRTLEAQAAARNMALADYLQLFAQAGEIADSSMQLTTEEFDVLLEKVSEGVPALPPLPAEFSRADIYAGHD